ncbi:MAG: hypothetical protein AB7P03_20735 [Kofleriaceae bacterium]
MPKLVVAVAFLALACSSNKEPGGAGSADQKTLEAPLPSCPPGSLVENGACVPVITAEKVQAVAQQQSRLDDLAKLLDKVEVAAAPIALLDGFRQLDQWKALAATSEQLKTVDQVVTMLDEGVKKLRLFKGSLGEASARLGNLKGELDRLMNQTGVSARIEDVRATISAQVRSAVEPLAAQATDTIQNALTPLVAKLNDTADLVIGACAMAKMSGGGDKLKELCGQAKGVFGSAITYLDEIKAKPAQLFNDVSAQLSTQLQQLIDAETTKAIAAAQVMVNDALRLPPTAGGSDSGPAAGPAK